MYTKHPNQESTKMKMTNVNKFLKSVFKASLTYLRQLQNKVFKHFTAFKKNYSFFIASQFFFVSTFKADRDATISILIFMIFRKFLLTSSKKGCRDAFFKGTVVHNFPVGSTCSGSASCVQIAPGKESRCGEEEGDFLDVTLVG